MIHAILTSSPTGPLDNSYRVDGLDPSNSFYDLMKSILVDGMRGLIIAAYPDRYEQNDEMCDYFRNAFETVGIHFSTFDLWDYRYNFEKDEVLSYDFIVLAGGHTPTENSYFNEINLRYKLEGYDGIVLGMSAGSMNMADYVYFQPELEGESYNWFKRDGRGLGLCDISIVPHFQMIKNYYLDDRSLVYDIILNDSYGRKFYVIEDGSYIYVRGDEVFVCGLCFIMDDGVVSLCSKRNQIVRIK